MNFRHEYRHAQVSLNSSNSNVVLTYVFIPDEVISVVSAYMQL